MRILTVDIETAPNLVTVWGLWQQNVAINQIADAGYVMCWSAKWYGERHVYFDSIHQSSPGRMLRNVHRLLDKADAVVHYNGANFDIPTLNKEFVQRQMKPPAPYKQVDLLRVVREQFRFPSNKLDYVAQALGLGKKLRHAGHELWLKCMAKDPKAWKVMERYNRQDVLLTERLYDRLLPWIKAHPNYGAFDPDAQCPNCGSTRSQRMGVRITTTLRYTRWQCQDCGSWYRGTVCVKGTRAKFVSIA